MIRNFSILIKDISAEQLGTQLGEEKGPPSTAASVASCEFVCALVLHNYVGKKTNFENLTWYFFKNKRLN